MELFEVLTALLVVGFAVYSKSKKKAKKHKENMGTWEGAQAPSGLPVNVQPLAQMAPVTFVQQTMPLPEKEKKEGTFPKASGTIPASITFPEGVDPCHDAMYEDHEKPAALLESRQGETSPLAQEMVRGIVLGEILNNPRFKNYSRK